MLLNPETKAFKGNSVFGEWIMKEDLPVFNYTADPRTCEDVVWTPKPYPQTRRNFHFIGNKAISFLVDNFGTSGVWDELDCTRWLTAADMHKGGTGFTTVVDADGSEWGTNVFKNPVDLNPERHFGPFAFGIYPSRNGLNIERDMIMPEGDVPWAFIRVRVSLDDDQPVRTFQLKEEWALKPLYMAFMVFHEERVKMAKEVSYEVALGNKIVAKEIFAGDAFGGKTGKEATMMIESFNDGFDASTDGEQHPTLTFTGDVTLEPGQTKEFYFRFGRFDETEIDAPAFFEQSLKATKVRLPKGSCDDLPLTSAEVVWNAAAVYGMVFKDEVLGDFTINQGSGYGFDTGFNAAPRDPLQYASAMSYMEPKLALETIRNTTAWCWADSDMPFALTADKEPTLSCFRPSDQNLWVLLAACDYHAMTGDLTSFDEEVHYSPFDENAEPLTLKESLVRHFRFFVDFVGRGALGHPRMLNADWQDGVIDQFKQGYTEEEMEKHASSVLNSAVAAYILPKFAGLMAKLGEAAIAAEAREQAADLRALVAKAHNGKYFWRAVTPDGKPVGDNICWIESQAFALLCGAAEDAGLVDSVLEFIDENNAAGSPLGPRTMFPVPEGSIGTLGQASLGGVWYALNQYLTAGAVKCGRIEWAKKNLEKMSMRNKTAQYPTQWNGVLSGPDTWNAPESPRPGETWEGADPSTDLEQIKLWIEHCPEEAKGIEVGLIELGMHMSMQSFPIGNTHSHVHPVMGLVRIGGAFVDENCNLVVGTGVEFEAPHWKLNKDGSGWILTDQEITVTSPNGTFTGTGKVKF